MKEITPGAIRTAAITLYPNAGPATRNRQAIVPTQAIINHAAEHELCPHIKVARYEVKRKAKEPATWAWVQAFVRNSKKPNLAALACFMYLTGSRISQALAVQWDDVDFKARKVLIRATDKGDDDRRAHMPPEFDRRPGEHPRRSRRQSVRFQVTRKLPHTVERRNSPGRYQTSVLSRLPAWLCHWPA